jgi:hypothetical protein
MFIVINLIYFNASSIKYFETELYPGFITNNMLRLVYSLLALAVLWISFEIIIKYKSRYKPVRSFIRNRLLLKLLIIGILGFNCYNTYINYNQKGIGYGYYWEGNAAQAAIEKTDLPVIEKMELWFAEFTGMILILLVTLSQGEKGNKSYIMIAVAVYFISSIISGNRGSLFYFIISLGFSLSYFYGYKNKIFAKVLYAGPIIMAIGSIIILSVTGRISYNYKDNIKSQLAYRFDLSDYAATIIAGNKAIMFNGDQIVDAFYYSIPKVLYPHKYDVYRNSIANQLYNAKLDVFNDFTDTYFSIGAQLGGIIGFILFPFMIVLILYWIEQLIYRFMPIMSYYIIILLSPLFLRAETDLNTIMGTWRLIPLYIICGSIAFCLFNKKQYYNNYKNESLAGSMSAQQF